MPGINNKVTVIITSMSVLLRASNGETYAPISDYRRRRDGTDGYITDDERR